MAAEKRVRAPRTDAYKVSVKEMDIIEGLNLRTDYGDLDELIEIMIKTPDKIPPLRGFKKGGRYVIIQGHRRRMAGLKAVEKSGKDVMLWVLPETKGYTDEERTIDMFVSNEGKKLTLLEQAEGVFRLTEKYKLDEHAISDRIHKSITYVRNCIKLKSAPEDIQKLMADEYVSPTLVISMFKEHDLDEAVQIIRDTVYSNKTDADSERKNQMAIDFKEEAEVVFPVPATDGGSNANEEQSGAGRLNIYSETVIAPEVEEKPRKPRKITQKDINENLQKENSIGHFKKVIKRSEQEPVNEDKAEEFMFIQRLVLGEVNEKELARRYFNGKVVDVEKF